jgi:hypothetical protein
MRRSSGCLKRGSSGAGKRTWRRFGWRNCRRKTPQGGGAMKRVRAEVEITRRTSVEFEVDDDADPEEIKETALEEAELAEWDDDPPDVVSIEIIEPSS